ncbi:peptidase M76 [Zychaea mexicana]|uniref:peptidase M76 n=1 Tax=Zychaea mexicana TaxID=64656 RepID=UPI0022FF3986|nr:peptidase M76 [Zychaea mexicana]KAI9494774.1 peptidase M76 [Zychaea mexicana]
MRFYESPKFKTTEQECTAELAGILETSPKVARLLQGIFTLNPRALKRGVTCRPCHGTEQSSRMGYYDGRYKRVVLCCDNIRSKQQQEETLVHELVHAFDASRTGRFTSMCHVVACGEIRASAIGQCHDIKSPSRKRECIWEDAVRSTAIHCGGKDFATVFVQQVFENCVKDTAPFIQPRAATHQQKQQQQ